LVSKTRKLPDTRIFGPMKDRLGLRFSFAGTAFLNRYADLLDPFNLTPGRVLALSFLHEHPGCGQSSLAHALEVNEASAMAMIDKLEALRLVERKAGRNRRTNALHLTETGEAAFDEALALEQVLTRRLLRWMKPSDLSTFMNQVDEVRVRASSFDRETTASRAATKPAPRKARRSPAARTKGTRAS
jgi:DNA-binding MarR family transcriptional regulator